MKKKKYRLNVNVDKDGSKILKRKIIDKGLPGIQIMKYAAFPKKLLVILEFMIHVF